MASFPETSRLLNEGAGNPPWLLRYRSSKAFLTATICFAIFTDAFIYGVVVPVFPFSLRERSNVPENEVQQWISLLFGIYGAAIVVGSPIFGWFADHSSSRRVPLLVSLLTLAGATILLCVGESVYVVFTSRLLQGLSSAAVYAVGLALLVDTVGREEIGQWMGFALSSSSIGLVVSPVLGGLVYSRSGYYAVFAMILSIILIDILLRVAAIEKKTAARWLGPGQISSHGDRTEGYATFPGNPNSNDRSSPPANDGYAAQSVGRDDLARTNDLVSSKGSPNRKFQAPTTLILLRSRRLLTAIYGVFIQVAVLASFDTILPLFVKRTFGWNSLQAGLIFLTIAIPTLAGPLAGRLSDRHGPRWIAISGFLLTAPTLVLLRLVNTNNSTHVVLLCGLLMLTGATLTLIISPLAAELSFVVEEMERKNPSIFGRSGAYGQAFALFNCAMASATICGPVWAGLIASKFGWNTATWTLAVLCASGAVPVFFFTGNPTTPKSSVREQRAEA